MGGRRGGSGVIIISRASKTDIMRCLSPPLLLKVGDGSGSECQRMCGQGAILPYILLAMRIRQMHGADAWVRCAWGRCIGCHHSDLIAASGCDMVRP